MITKEKYQELRERLERFELWLNGRTSYDPKEIPSDVPTVTNDERSSIEVYEFCTNPPERYTLYIGENPAGYTAPGSKHMATTWTGEYLGDVTFGRKYRDNFGGTRIPINVEAINGKSYYGTYYTSSGNYAHIRIKKGKR
jgi:hypothetical protein